MAVIKGDQFFIIDPAQPPKAGTMLKPVKLMIGDKNGDHVLQANSGDMVGELKVTAVWVKDTITVDMGKGPIKITGVTFYRSGGPAVFTPIDGTVLHDAKLKFASYVKQSTQVSMKALGPPCFTFGTMILTPKGERAVQDLRAGDVVTTRDHGAQCLRWVGHRRVSGLGPFAPVEFLAGALGNDAALLVSPQHRMLISGWRAEMLFGQPEILVAAKHLLNGVTIRSFLTPMVEYYHLLFDQHEIVFAQGIPTESLYPGRGVLAGDREMCVELHALFPGLGDAAQAWPFAAPVIEGAAARVLRQYSASR